MIRTVRPQITLVASVHLRCSGQQVRDHPLVFRPVVRMGDGCRRQRQEAVGIAPEELTHGGVDPLELPKAQAVDGDQRHPAAGQIERLAEQLRLRQELLRQPGIVQSDAGLACQ